jgi:hypothetical protein
MSDTAKIIIGINCAKDCLQRACDELEVEDISHGVTSYIERQVELAWNYLRNIRDLITVKTTGSITEESRNCQARSNRLTSIFNGSCDGQPSG